MMMLDDSAGHGAMFFEVHVAINFVTSFMNNVVPQGRIKVFGEALARALMNKYEGHWFPESPLKGSAYRCFEFGAYIEPELKVAARQAGLRCRDVLICVPSEMSIWVDPGTVSYRIGIEGPVKPVLNESGCVVTCFFDPDVEDPDPDPPGITKAISSCEETEIVEKSKPRKFTPKRGKAKLSVACEDLKFVTKNGGLESATDYDDLEPLEPYFTTEDMKSGILCEDEFTSNQRASTDEPAYGNSRRRRSRRSKKKSPNKVGNNNGNRGRNSDKRRQNNDNNNNSKMCSNNYQNSSGSATGSGSSSGASSSGKSTSGNTTGTSSSAASTSGTSTSSSGTSCGSSSSSSSSGGSGSSSGGSITSSSSGGSSSSSSSSKVTTTTTTTTTSSSSSAANSGINTNRNSTAVSGRNSRSSSGRNSRGGSNSNNGNSNPNITNTNSNSSRNSNHHRNRNVLQHQSIVISNSSYSSRV